MCTGSTRRLRLCARTSTEVIREGAEPAGVRRDRARSGATRLSGLADGAVDDGTDGALETLTEEFLSASGESWGGTRRGVTVGALLDRPDVTVDPDATHVRVAADGYAVCVPLRTALNAVLAVERDKESLAVAHVPPFVAPVDAGRTMKGVRELRFLRLAPEEYEDLGY
ncbi:MAG: pterin operon protein [Halorubrum sp.]|uniref:pterin operon protein n=1 Tax=Halorubrum sp. TaxID=1879286 RepID=UPI003970F71C